MGRKVNKKGESLVEATIVLPIMILTVLSLIMLLIYFYSCLNAQISAHEQLLYMQKESTSTFKINKIDKETSLKVGGIIGKFMKKTIKCKIYCIKEERLIRLGEVINDNS